MLYIKSGSSNVLYVRLFKHCTVSKAVQSLLCIYRAVETMRCMCCWCCRGPGCTRDQCRTCQQQRDMEARPTAPAPVSLSQPLYCTHLEIGWQASAWLTVQMSEGISHVDYSERMQRMLSSLRRFDLFDQRKVKVVCLEIVIRTAHDGWHIVVIFLICVTSPLNNNLEIKYMRGERCRVIKEEAVYPC